MRASPHDSPAQGRPLGGQSLSQADWIMTARRCFIESGIDAVKVVPLAKLLGATTGSFYWHFKSRKQLHDALLRDWVESNGMPFVAAVEAAGPDVRDQFLAFVGVWVFDRGFSSAYDEAVRAWAHRSQQVSAVLREVEAKRIELLKALLRRFGYEETEAYIRARITYFHQVGYYNMGIRESRRERLRLNRYYVEALTGDSWYRTLSEAELLAKLGGTEADL